MDNLHGTILRCPVCSDEGNHVVRVFARRGSDPDENEIADGLTALETSSLERRSAVVLEYRCEAGDHRWKIVFQQHKGQEFHRHRV